jgi:hypothetical protein
VIKPNCNRGKTYVKTNNQLCDSSGYRSPSETTNNFMREPTSAARPSARPVVLLSQALGRASKESARVRALSFPGSSQSKSERQMKKQNTRKMKWTVCAAVFIGLIAMIQAEGQEQATEITSVAKDDDYKIEWITPKLPPMPPVMKDGKLMTWEEVYGPPPEPKPFPVKRYANPKPSVPVDPDAQWIGIKRQLAPWMTEEQLRAKPAETPAIQAARRMAMSKGAFVPKVDPIQLRIETQKKAAMKSQAAMLRDSGEGANEMEEDSGGGIPTLHFISFLYGSLGYTEYVLWVTDAPPDEWFEIYFADELNPNHWQLAHLGPPEFGFGTSVQQYFVYAYGHPPMGFFRMFPFQDSDSDGISDGMEVALFKSDPNNPDSAFLRDQDGDGQPDLPDAADNYITDGDEDFDGDGLSNLKELQLGTNPLIPQDYSADSDFDGLPDWVEDLIWTYQGISDPDLRDDSDGDGVDNYTETALQTDPSWPDAVYGYWNFYNLPDEQRAFILDPITVGRVTVPGPLTLGDSARTNDLIYDTAGTLGSYLHLEVRRDEDGEGNSLTNHDTILFGGAFLSPPGGMGMDMLVDGNEAGDAFISMKDLMATTTGLFADIWKEGKVSDIIDQLNIQTIFVLQQRSMLRTIVRMRELQLTVNLLDTSTVTHMRSRTVISQIDTETLLFQETSARIAHYQGQNWWSRAGFWVSAAGRVASIYNIWQSSLSIRDAAIPYIRDVQRRCDNNFDTAADLAVALGNLADEFAPGFMLGEFWLIYWNLLIQFDGYDSQC